MKNVSYLHLFSYRPDFKNKKIGVLDKNKTVFNIKKLIADIIGGKNITANFKHNHERYIVYKRFGAIYVEGESGKKGINDFEIYTWLRILKIITKESQKFSERQDQIKKIERRLIAKHGSIASAASKVGDKACGLLSLLLLLNESSLPKEFIVALEKALDKQ